MTGGYIATWLPDFSPFLGDYGTLARGRLLTEGNLEELDYVSIGDNAGMAAMTSFKFSHDVTISADAGAESLGAGFSVAFNSEGSFLYHFQNAKMHRIKNKGQFFQELATKILTGEIPWDDSFVVVDEVVLAEQSTILVSKTSGSNVRVSASGSSNAKVNFADPSLNLAFATSKGTIFDYSGHVDSRPLYHAVKPTIKPRGAVESDGPPRRPTGPTFGQIYKGAKKLLSGRELEPHEIEIEVLEKNLVDAKLLLNGRVARFNIAFEEVTPNQVLADYIKDDEAALPIEQFLVMET